MLLYLKPLGRFQINQRSVPRYIVHPILRTLSGRTCRTKIFFPHTIKVNQTQTLRMASCMQRRERVNYRRHRHHVFCVFDWWEYAAQPSSSSQGNHLQAKEKERQKQLSSLSKPSAGQRSAASRFVPRKFLPFL